MIISIVRDKEQFPLTVTELIQLVDKISASRVESDEHDIELYLDVKVLIQADKPIKDKIKDGDLKTVDDLWKNVDDLIDINNTPILIEQ